MIAEKYVPYQNIPEGAGKTVEELKALGERLFPFSHFSFQLAMRVYDWTTASFARLVFMKIFQYRGIEQTPFPIDQPSITQQIWMSKWGTYTPQDPYFMKSFMMKPASSQQDVQTQLENVATELHKFSDVQNRLLSAAMQALPRTSIMPKSQLFSGQMDIYQLGLEHFGIEFLECPLNKGPVSESLTFAFESATTSYVSQGKTITTKMVWSFTDSVKDAMHYSNGILLVANCPGDSWVWETAAYVTPLSDDPTKTEYTFMAGSQFEVQSVEHQVTIGGKEVVVITLQPKPSMKPKPSIEQAVTRLKIPEIARREGLPGAPKGGEYEHFVACSAASRFNFMPGQKTGGRRRACVDMINRPLTSGLGQ